MRYIRAGHINTELYLRYLTHIEPFLSKDRPVVIFQDNLACHGKDEIVDFCISKQIHLFNFPGKTSHLLQPLDKLFGPFKTRLEHVKQEAMIVSQRTIPKEKVTILTRFTMDRLPSDMVRSSFEKTGLFPLNREVITPDLLIGDNLESERRSYTEAPMLHEPVDLHLQMQVFDENQREIPSKEETFRNKETQTDKIQSLPCSLCIQQDVSVHPAVTAGVVGLDVASVFIQNTCATKTSKTDRRKRTTPIGKCLTNASEIACRKKERADEKRLNKQKNLEEKQAKKEALMKHIAAKKDAKAAAQKHKEKITQALNEAKHGLIQRSRCLTCHEKVNFSDQIPCVICEAKYHIQCISEKNSFVTVCTLCLTK